MLVVLGALLVVSLALVSLLLLLQVIQIGHHQAAGMQLGGSVVHHVNGHQLTLVVVGFLGGCDGVVAFLDGQGDHLVGNAADFLRLGFGGLDAAVPNEVGHLVTQQRLALVRGATQLALMCHGIFPPSRAVETRNAGKPCPGRSSIL